MGKETVDKIQHPFMIKKKKLSKSDIERMYFNIIKTIYDKLTASIILNSEMLKVFLLRSETKTQCPF